MNESTFEEDANWLHKLIHRYYKTDLNQL